MNLKTINKTSYIQTIETDFHMGGFFIADVYYKPISNILDHSKQSINE